MYTQTLLYTKLYIFSSNQSYIMLYYRYTLPIPKYLCILTLKHIIVGYKFSTSYIYTYVFNLKLKIETKSQIVVKGNCWSLFVVVNKTYVIV